MVAGSNPACGIKAQPVGASVVNPIFERGDSFYGVATPAGKTIWAAGSNGKAVRSEDQGASWSLQLTPTHETLQDISAWDAQRAVAFYELANDNHACDFGLRISDCGLDGTQSAIHNPKSAIASHSTPSLS